MATESTRHTEESVKLNVAGLKIAEASRTMAQESSSLTAEAVDIARTTRTDSANMVVISAVTLVFLPATFTAVSVCLPPSEAACANMAQTFFSTSFFDFHPTNPENRVSSWIWLYWTVTAVLTLIVMASWRVTRNYAHRKEHPSANAEMKA